MSSSYNQAIGDLSFGKRCRYLRIRLENTSSDASDLYLKHIGFELLEDKYIINGNNYIYNKKEINTRGWNTIESMSYKVFVTQPMTDIRFMFSKDREQWVSIKNGSAYKYSSISFSSAMTLDDIKVLNATAMDMFIGGDLFIVAILNTTHASKTPTLENIELKYTTSDSVNNLVKLDPHDFECVYSPDENKVTVKNTSGGDKIFKVLVS